MMTVFQLRISAAFLAGAAFFCMARCVAAAPVEWKASDGGNGHFYEFVQVFRLNTWDAARAAAEARTFAGVHGHLGTITSAGEQSFVSSLPQVNITLPWLGGFQATGSTELDQGWSWITGEPWDFTFWATNPLEPNDFTSGKPTYVEYGTEQHLSLYPPSIGSGWNDLNQNLGLSNSYLVEFEVPEPSSAVLLVPAAVAMLRRRRRSPNPYSAGGRNAEANNGWVLWHHASDRQRA